MKLFHLPTRIVFLFSCCLLLTSCFEFIEDIQHKSDGSGTIKATLNLSKSSTKVASLMKLKNVNGIAIPSEATVRSEMENLIRILKQTKGISQVHYQLDFTHYIATVSCHYTSIDALNAFGSTLAAHFKSSIDPKSYGYQATTGTFTRSDNYFSSFSKAYQQIAEHDRKYLDDASYTQIIRFDKPIKSQQNPATQIARSGQAVLIKLKVADLINGKASLSNTIKLQMP